MMNTEIQALIQRRRLQLLVHSAIYYGYGESIVSDEQWKNWALELEELQAHYTKEAAAAPYAKAFRDFDHSTGFNLPYREPAVMAKALQLLRLRNLYEKEMT